MLEAKPMNLYGTGGGGFDSGVSSGESSRRNSVGFKEYVRNRRYTMLSRPNRITAPIPSSVPDGTRKSSSGESSVGDLPDDLDDDLSPRPLYQRRMSVPEKVFLSADYAILRPSDDMDVRFEIVAAFDRHTDPYRHYMQSLTCYDLQPNHGAVVVIDGDLKIHKALTALSQCGHQAAVVSNLEVKGGFGILTITDCLRAIVMASEGVHKVAEQTVAEFLKINNRKSLIACDVATSVWDAARLICLNRVHRIPVVQYEDGVDTKKAQGDLLYILSLRTVFLETVLKLADPKLSLGPHIKQATLNFKKLGTWFNLVTINEDSLTSDAISLFLERRISSVPIVDSHGRVKAVLSKSDVMSELVRHPSNYLEILDIPAMDIANANASPPLLTPTMTVFQTITMLVNSERQSLVVVDVDQKPLGVVSYSDVMDYIQNCSDVHHKFSLA